MYKEDRVPSFWNFCVRVGGFAFILLGLSEQTHEEF